MRPWPYKIVQWHLNNDLKNEYDLKNKDNLQNEDDLKNEGDLKNEDDLKNKVYLKNAYLPIPTRVMGCYGCPYKGDENYR